MGLLSFGELLEPTSTSTRTLFEPLPFRKRQFKRSWTSEGNRGKTYQHGAAHIGSSTHCSCRWLQDFWYWDKSWNQPQVLQLAALTINMTINTVYHL